MHSFSRLRLLKLCLSHYLPVVRFGFIFCPVLSNELEIAIVLYIIKPISVGQIFLKSYTLQAFRVGLNLNC